MPFTRGSAMKTLFLALCAVSMHVASGQTLLNPSFESGDFGEWSTSPGASVVANGAGNGQSGSNSGAGSWFAMLTGNGKWIRQD
eukprot:2661752-Rhodomonas_salina.1